MTNNLSNVSFGSRSGYRRFPFVKVENRGRSDFLYDRLAQRFHVHLKVEAYDEDGKERWIASHHWHPKALESQGSSRYMPNFVSRDIGNSIGLTAADRAKGPWEKGNENYFLNVPNISMSRAEEILSVYKTEMEIDTATSPAFISSQSSGSARAPRQENSSSIITANRSSGGRIEDSGVSSGSISRSTARLKRRLNDPNAVAAANEEQRKERLWQKELTARADLYSRILDDDVRESVVKIVDRSEKLVASLRSQLDAKCREMEQLRTQRRLDDESFCQPISDEDIKRILLQHGGLCSANLTNPEWYKENKDACKDLFGFETFEHMVVFITEVLWPENFPAGFKRHVGFDNASKFTELMKCLVTKMRFHRKLTLKALGAIWGRDWSTISKYIKKWAPLWGEAGLDFSILDVPTAFQERAMPKEFRDANMASVGALVDGKVFMTEECRGHSAIKNAMYNDKTHHAGVLLLTWILPYGLTFEHSCLYCGRCTESAAVKLWGSK